MNSLMNFLIDSLALSATFIFGSTGEIITEKAGHLNLGIPGIMCMGGAGGCMMISIAMNNNFPPYLIVIMGILGAFAMGGLMGLLYSFFADTLRANQNVTGLTMTTFGVGLMKVLMLKEDIINMKGSRLNLAVQYFRFPFSGRSDKLQMLGVMFFLALVIALLASYMLGRTRVGLNLRSVGENPATADAAGINVTRYKYVATILGSGVAGLGGLYYIVDWMGSNEAYKTVEGLGWLSVALVIFVLWKPWLTIPSGFIFSVLYTCANHVTSIKGINVKFEDTYIFQMLPYLFTIVVLIISSIRNKRENQPPASLGLSYFREDR
ncbi:MAG: ABC transporter permease [Clostridia bacterium]|nr:ABC transporter permease [Clostridia bacterium]